MTSTMNAPSTDESAADPASQTETGAARDLHADKYNDPRVKISRRGILLGVAVVLFGIGGAAFSIWARKTSLVQTRAFWGNDTIEALQLAEEVELIVDDKQNADGSPAAPVRLSGMPGLGHLRHTLLDDRSYQWDTVRTVQASAGETDRDAPAEGTTMILRLTDPTAKRFPEARLRLDLENGWLGPDGGDKEVRLNERFREAVPLFLRRIVNFEPLHLDARRQKESGASE